MLGYLGDVGFNYFLATTDRSIKSQEDSTRTVSTLQTIMYIHSTTKQYLSLTLSSPFQLIVMRPVLTTALLNQFAVSSDLEHQLNDQSIIHNLKIFFFSQKLSIVNCLSIVNKYRIYSPVIDLEIL